jgi:hypothetical protein
MILPPVRADARFHCIERSVLGTLMLRLYTGEKTLQGLW